MNKLIRSQLLNDKESRVFKILLDKILKKILKISNYDNYFKI